MADMTRPIVYGVLGVAVIATYFWYTQDSTPPSTTETKTVVAKPPPGAGEDLTEDDLTARFSSPKGNLRDIFLPLVKPDVDTSVLADASKNIGQIPAALASGDGNWVFTGYAVVNGSQMALLENTATRQAGYVKEGDAWKSTRVLKITSESVVLADKTGAPVAVLRYSPDDQPKPKPPPDSGFHPVNVGPALVGPIGANIEVRPIAPAKKPRN